MPPPRRDPGVFLDAPAAELIKLRSVGEHRFRGIRDDGSLGEEVRFELGAGGMPVRVRRHSNYDERPAGEST